MNNTHSEMDYIIQFCACANLRKAARSVTQAYERKMESTGLKVTQYYMLVNIARHDKISISNLGDVMLLDQSTVTRNVNVLKNSGYVDIARDPIDSRTKSVSITDIGLAKLEEATPIWLQIQEKIEKDIGQEKYADLLETLKKLQEFVESYDR
ncbi:MarR family winged helix-turn-helix transcriptional regulator [Sporosarcina sp. ACRSM]|uniref:MarR family winged helix-turn-helix transcriptional regulator n=1 Tax=Sporosarcina sp. ACRSM TaxID=2918216 RepID=UPI001EF66B96|nr:MarR family winged helix-turn-helix transcriptional regulator [Sporosarcina sp. ACRSM]MCG7337579.1 MarR family winged helix-turn-helix transcriptional regulator [Sporosarcina sp. ACRSM]